MVGRAVQSSKASDAKQKPLLVFGVTERALAHEWSPAVALTRVRLGALGRAARTNHRAIVIVVEREALYADLVHLDGHLALLDPLDLLVVVLVVRSVTGYVANGIGRYDGALHGQARSTVGFLDAIRAGELDERDVVCGELVIARVLLVLGMNDYALVFDELVVVVLGVVVAVEEVNERLGLVGEAMAGCYDPLIVQQTTTAFRVIVLALVLGLVHYFQMKLFFR